MSNTLISYGLAQAGRAVVEVTFDDKRRPHARPLALFDILSATELIIRGRILEIETFRAEESGIAIPEIRQHELIYGSRRFRFTQIPHELYQTTGAKIPNIGLYNELGTLVRNLHNGTIDLNSALETTLRFAYEVLEPLVISFWNELLVAHSPEFEFDADSHLQKYLEEFGIDVTPRRNHEDD